MWLDFSRCAQNTLTAAAHNGELPLCTLACWMSAGLIDEKQAAAFLGQFKAQNSQEKSLADQFLDELGRLAPIHMNGFSAGRFASMMHRQPKAGRFYNDMRSKGLSKADTDQLLIRVVKRSAAFSQILFSKKEEPASVNEAFFFFNEPRILQKIVRDFRSKDTAALDLAAVACMLSIRRRYTYLSMDELCKQAHASWFEALGKVLYSLCRRGQSGFEEVGKSFLYLIDFPQTKSESFAAAALAHHQRLDHAADKHSCAPVPKTQKSQINPPKPEHHAKQAVPNPKPARPNAVTEKKQDSRLQNLQPVSSSGQRQELQAPGQPDQPCNLSNPDQGKECVSISGPQKPQPTASARKSVRFKPAFSESSIPAGFSVRQYQKSVQAAAAKISLEDPLRQQKARINWQAIYKNSPFSRSLDQEHFEALLDQIFAADQGSTCFDAMLENSQTAWKPYVSLQIRNCETPAQRLVYEQAQSSLPAAGHDDFFELLEQRIFIHVICGWIRKSGRLQNYLQEHAGNDGASLDGSDPYEARRFVQGLLAAGKSAGARKKIMSDFCALVHVRYGFWEVQSHLNQPNLREDELYGLLFCELMVLVCSENSWILFPFSKAMVQAAREVLEYRTAFLEQLDQNPLPWRL